MMKTFYVFQHGPPHLVNLVRSSPPPQAVHPPISQGLMPHHGAQLVQASPHTLIHVSHMPPDQGQFTHLGGQTILQSSQQLLQPAPDAHQMIAPPPGHPFHPGVPPGHQGPPIPHHLLGPPPPSYSPSQHLARSPNVENRFVKTHQIKLVHLFVLCLSVHPYICLSVCLLSLTFRIHVICHTQTFFVYFFFFFYLGLV